MVSSIKDCVNLEKHANIIISSNKYFYLWLITLFDLFLFWLENILELSVEFLFYYKDTILKQMICPQRITKLW